MSEPNNWSAYVPDLPGYIAAATLGKRSGSDSEAIALYETLEEEGEPAPERGAAQVVEV
jgi:predicted RNase H-like HicB family nuclease